MPALAGAIITGKGLAAGGAAGVRKAGTDVAVTIDDEWHLESDTKAMTAAITRWGGWSPSATGGGGPAASKACDEAASKRIRLHLGE